MGVCTSKVDVSHVLGFFRPERFENWIRLKGGCLFLNWTVIQFHCNYEVKNTLWYSALYRITIGVCTSKVDVPHVLGFFRPERFENWIRLKGGGVSF